MRFDWSFQPFAWKMTNVRLLFIALYKDVFDEVDRWYTNSCLHSTLVRKYSQPRTRTLRLSRLGFHPHFCLIRTAHAKILTSSCHGVLLFLALLAGIMASIKHKRVVTTI